MQQRFDAAQSAKWLRKLHRRGALTHAEYVVGETMLWSCRGKDSDRGAVSYRRLAELARVSRTTAMKAVAALTGLGFIRKNRRRALVPWLGGLASRQAANVYVFAVAVITEISEWPVYRRQEGKKDCQEINKALWRRRDRPVWPVRTVAEQLAALAASG